MRTTIDTAGRVVVPKSVRDMLGLRGGEEVEISARSGRIEIEIPSTPMELVPEGAGVVAVPSVDLPVLTADEVRDTLEAIRR